MGVFAFKHFCLVFLSSLQIAKEQNQFILAIKLKPNNYLFSNSCRLPRVHEYTQILNKVSLKKITLNKMTERYTFGGSLNAITCHAWNKDRSQIALSPNNNEIHIYSRESNWKLVDVLNQHDLRVMDIDWARNTNRIVSCAADRNAYVWSQGEDGKWKPTLVLLRINRAATCVKWSPNENKFAVGSGARLISVCYFESENDWWVSKHIKKPIRSTITSLDWHPNNALLVAGSTDYKVRVFSAYIKDIEDQPTPTPWGNRMTLGHLMAEFKNAANTGGGWIHSVSFSGDGNRICWVGHDSCINIADSTNGNILRCKTEHLPFLSCVWINLDSVVVAGHSCVPLVFSVDGNKINFTAKLDTTQKKETSGISAMRIFQSLDRNSRTENSDSFIESIHQNAISCVRIYSGDKLSCNKISTSGTDGQLVIWDLDSKLINSLKNLNLDGK